MRNEYDDMGFALTEILRGNLRIIADCKMNNRRIEELMKSNLEKCRASKEKPDLKDRMSYMNDDTRIVNNNKVKKTVDGILKKGQYDECRG